LHRAVLAALIVMLVAFGVLATPVQAATSTAKVVVVVGPVGSHTAHYKSDADEIVTEARRYTSNVVKLYTPNATWSRVRAAMQGASVFVYLGHGNGWPSIYAPFQTQTKDGLGLDPSTGADSTKTVYYGEEYLRANVRFAPNAVVLLFHLCYASGNAEPGLTEGSLSTARQRVDNYGAGFIGAGARAVFAEGHPEHPVTSYVRQLFTTNRSMNTIFRSAPTWHGHLQGPSDSQRTPGLRFELDSDTTTPSGFYRSLVGDFALTASKVTGVRPVSTAIHPSEFVVPGNAEVVASAGIPMFASAAAAADPTAAGTKTLAVATHLRLTDEAAPAADGTRIFAATVTGSSTTGFVRATGIAPRDSEGPDFWSFDESNPMLSPNGDNVYDELVLTPRFSEPVTATFVVKNTAGTTVKSASMTGDITRFAWDLQNSSGIVVPDGSYTWSVKGKDAWGNPAATRTGEFIVDGTPPVTKAVPSSTAGAGGWIVSPVDVTLTAKDSLSGVKAIYWRVDAGTSKTYVDVARVTANGTHVFEYHATDRAGVKEAWKKLTFKIDTRGPAITVALSGTAGETAGTWRGPVTLKPTFTDATSGIATKTASVDGAAAVALSTTSIVVDGEGAHSVVFGGTDVAGNKGSTTVTLLIDTVAPVLVLAAPDAPPGTVTPNGDARTESVRIPYSISEAAVVTAIIANTDGATVRTITGKLPGGDAAIEWDGRTSGGKAVPDGRYTVTMTGKDPAGNASEPVTAPVDVYASLKAASRTPASFFPQDGDALAAKTTLSYTLLTPATVTVQVVDAAGTVVRTAYADRAMPAGAASWNWSGKLPDGTYAKRGTYRLVVSATNGTQAATQTLSVFADAFRITTSVPSAVRGKAFTVTARTVEGLSTAPVLTIREPGLTARTVAMTKVSSTTWTARVTPKTTAAPGTMTLTVKAKDTAGGTNSSVLKLALQ